MQLGCAMPGYDRIRAILWALGTAKVLLSSLWAPHLLCDLSKTQQLLPPRAVLALGAWERFPSWDTSLLRCHLRCRALTKPMATSTDNVTSNWLWEPQIHSHTCQQARREKPIAPKPWEKFWEKKSGAPTTRALILCGVFQKHLEADHSCTW